MWEAIYGPAIVAFKQGAVTAAPKAMQAFGAALITYAGYRIYKELRFKSSKMAWLAAHWEDVGVGKTIAGKTFAPKFVRETRVNEYVTKGYFKLPLGMSIDDVRKKIDAIELALNAEVDVYRENAYCVVEVSLGHLHDFEPYNHPFILDKFREKNYLLPISIGHSKKGYQIVDLVEHPHLLVGGQTAGGKSVFLRQALVPLLDYRTPDELEVYMIDLKGGLEFQIFEQCPHVKKIAKDPYESLEVLMEINDEMEKRFELWREMRIEKIQEFPNKKEQPPYILLVIDELAEISPESVNSSEVWPLMSKWEKLIKDAGIELIRDKKNPDIILGIKAKSVMEKLHSLLSRILRLARALGIHVIVATQRPDSKVLSGQEKQNIPITVAFKVRNELNSRILLGDGCDDAFTKIPPGAKGRAIFQVGNETIQVQVPHLSFKQARQLLFDLMIELEND